MSQKQLFRAFTELTKDDWLLKAEKDLKGQSIADLSSDWYGINIKPYYSIEDNEPHLNLASNNRSGWINYVEINVDEEAAANSLAQRNLMQGATGILFTLKNKVDFSVLLANIDLQHCAVSFSGMIDAKDYIGFLTQGQEINGFINSREMITQSVSDNFYPTLIKGSSENEVEELVEILLAGQQMLSPIKDEEAKTVIDNIAYQIEMSTNYFFGIAKIRALRLLLVRFYSAYKLAYPPDKFHLIARSSAWKNEAYEPHENMLKATTAAMAAISGGCNALLIAPGYTDEQEELVAKNISTLLEFESYLGKVADPAAGSYFIEKLTNELVNKVWDGFKNSLAL